MMAGGTRRRVGPGSRVGAGEGRGVFGGVEGVGAIKGLTTKLLHTRWGLVLLLLLLPIIDFLRSSTHRDGYAIQQMLWCLIQTLVGKAVTYLTLIQYL